MAVPNQTVCAAWASVDDMDATACPAVTDNPDRVTAMLGVASDYLWRRSGYQWPGSCTDTIRPFFYCRCICADARRLPLPATPATAVTSVVIDGVTLDPSTYRIENFDTLVRLDDEPWPCCGDQIDAGWTITYSHGALPPPSGVEAAKALACHLATANTAADCDPPPNTSSISRQGETIQLVPLDEAGATGIDLVDNFLNSTNPDNVPRSARVRSPHAPRTVV